MATCDKIVNDRSHHVGKEDQEQPEQPDSFLQNAVKHHPDPKYGCEQGKKIYFKKWHDSLLQARLSRFLLFVFYIMSLIYYAFCTTLSNLSEVSQGFLVCPNAYSARYARDPQAGRCKRRGCAGGAAPPAHPLLFQQGAALRVFQEKRENQKAWKSPTSFAGLSIMIA